MNWFFFQLRDIATETEGIIGISFKSYKEICRLEVRSWTDKSAILSLVGWERVCCKSPTSTVHLIFIPGELDVEVAG